MAMAPSSPRLPSPPPPAEIQIGPKSPSGSAASISHASPLEQSILDANSKRRIHPGTSAADMASGPPLIPLNELDSPFQLQEHLAALHYNHTASGTQALTRETALQLSQPPPGIDRTLWLYELCRFLISQTNSLIVGFLFDSPPCSASTCPEMRASEWQFLCAVHEQPKSCCAIDYCCHTLDWAANVVTDQKIFPSRFVVQSDAQNKNVGVKNLVNVFRRLHRVFAHAWFQHRSVFWAVEGQSGLYVFFKTVCDLYDLLLAENYKLPPEAEGLEAPPSEAEAAQPAPTILKPPAQQQHGQGEGDSAAPGTTAGEEDNFQPVGRTNTRRHIRSSPSTGSAVTTVMEADEEESDAVTRKMKDMHLSAPNPAVPSEESESEDVPVIVEQSVIDSVSPADSAEPQRMEGSDQGNVLDADQTIVEVCQTEVAGDEVEEKGPESTEEAPNKVEEPSSKDEGDASEDTPEGESSSGQE